MRKEARRRPKSPHTSIHRPRTSAQSAEADAGSSRTNRNRPNPRSSFKNRAGESVDFSEANRFHRHPAKKRCQPEERDEPAVVGLRLEPGLDRRDPFICKFLEPDVPILLALQPLGFRAEFPPPPFGNGEVGRLDRAPDRLAVDLDEGLVKSIAVPAEALGGLVNLLRFFRHLTHAVEYRVAKIAASS